MINFVIVEDNLLHKKKTEEIILKYMMKNKHEFKISSFEKETPQLLELIKKDEDNQIYILDFELPNATAIDIARAIRETDWRSPIIIFTAHGGMAYESFKQRLQILDFISKQFEAEKNMFELFDICLKQLGISKSLKFVSACVDYNIPYDKILYIYRDTCERKSFIVTQCTEYKVRKSLKAIKSELPKHFKHSHKACIINTKKIERYDWKNGIVFFDEDKHVDLLSKTHKKELSKI